MSYLSALPITKKYLSHADHFDEKVIESDVTLRDFLSGFLSYYPGWVKFLYRVRSVFVRILGMKQEQMPNSTLRVAPTDIPFEAGKQGGIFTVKDACEDSYWVAGASDKHLTVDLLVIKETPTNGQIRFHVGTVVHYHHWTGPVYFNVIRPFHHIVVKSMMRAGATVGKWS